MPAVSFPHPGGGPGPPGTGGEGGPLLCLEVVYGTGDLFRTGSAAGPGTIEEQWLAGEHQKSPMGPGHHDWMRMIQGSQGAIGVATWCSAKCEVRPRREALFLAGAGNLEPLVEASCRLFYRRLTDIHLLLDRNGLVNLLAETPEERGEVERRVAPWNLLYSVSGIEHDPEARMACLAREAEKELRACGGSLETFPLVSAGQVLERLLRPDVAPGGGERGWKERPLGAYRSVYFQTTLDKTPGFVARMRTLTEEAGLEEERVSCYLQPQLGGRCCHLEFVVACRAEDESDQGRVHRFCRDCAAPLVEAGAFFSRPHGAWAGPAMKGAASSAFLFRKAKEIFDPDGILAPGRLGLEGRETG